jgi:hypothetical protein
MSVSSYWSGLKPRLRPLPTTLLAMLASFTAVGQALKFDEALKAPLARSAADLRNQAQVFSARAATLAAAAPDALITDRAVSLDRFDLSWQIQQAIDVHQPLGDLSAVGIISRGDGSYRIDLNAFPQWNDLENLLVALLPTANFELLGAELVNRGFAASDVAKLKDYVATHDPAAAARSSKLPATLGFARLVKKYDHAQRPVPESLTLSYVYQRSLAEHEATRAWTCGLFKSLEAKSVRVLLSFYSEGSSSVIWAPSDRTAGIADILMTVRQPNFEQIATDEAKGETL